MSESTTASEAIAAALEQRIRLYVTQPTPNGQIGWGATMPELADVAIATVRSLSPEQLAELIGGEFEIRTSEGGWGSSWTDSATRRTLSAYSVPTKYTRVVGPWLPVIPVTHQGEETT